MPNLPTRIVLFLSSYIPLFLIMAIKYWTPHKYVGYGMLVLSVASLAILLIYLQAARRLGVDRLTVEDVSGKDADAMSYIVTYLIPFLDIKLDEPTNLASLLLLFVVLGVLYVHSNLIYINPTLNIMGYHLFEIEVEGGKKAALLSKKSYIARRSEIAVMSLGNEVLLELDNAR